MTNVKEDLVTTIKNICGMVEEVAERVRNWCPSRTEVREGNQKQTT
jgi:hypothetical protein